MKVKMLDGSGWRVYRYVSIQQPGNRIFYQRDSRKGQRTPRVYFDRELIPGSDEFDAAYNRIHRGEHKPAEKKDPKTATNTLRWLVEQHYASKAWEKLDEKSTRPKRRNILDGVCLEWHKTADREYGALPLAKLKPAHIKALRDLKQDVPGTANERVKALRSLFAWASDEDQHETDPLMKDNPAAAVNYLKVVSDGHTPWEERDAELYEAAYPLGTMKRLAFDLFLYTGGRVSDAHRMGLGMIVNGELHFTEHKGRNRGKPKRHRLPILAPLRASIDAFYAGTNVRRMTFLTTEKDTAFSAHYLSQRFSLWSQEGGIDKGKTAHGIRKLAAIRCVLAGATDAQLEALFGWTPGSKNVAVYRRMADQYRLEQQAAPLLLGERAANQNPIKFPQKAAK